MTVVAPEALAYYHPPMQFFRGIDLFSDTVTRPTAGMRRAMAEAEVGDDQLGEDPTILRLEEKCAELFGKSSALFFPTATMANQVAILLHTQPGTELLGAENCHIFLAEAGGPAVHSGVMAKPIATIDGTFTADELRKKTSVSTYIHFPRSSMLTIENTCNFGGGVAWPLEKLKSVTTAARELALKLHLDGSRLLNASTALHCAPKTLTEDFDTTTLCLSKGLGCPAGAILAFDKPHRFDVQRFRQRFGGSLRQSGVLAAAALYALENHVERLIEDHQNAKRLAMGLENLSPYLKVENTNPSTNMVFFGWQHPTTTAVQLQALCRERGLRVCPMGNTRVRMVTHLDVSSKQIEEAIEIIRKVCEAL